MIDQKAIERLKEKIDKMIHFDPTERGTMLSHQPGARWLFDGGVKKLIDQWYKEENEREKGCCTCANGRIDKPCGTCGIDHTFDNWEPKQ